CLTASASHAGGRFFIFRIGRERHGRNESALRKIVLIIKRQKLWYIKSLRTVADTIPAGSTRQDLPAKHIVSNRHQRLHLLFIEWFVLFVCTDICLKLIHVGHSR